MAGCVPLLGGIPALKPLLRQAFAISGRYGLRDIRLAALQILSEMYTGLGEKEELDTSKTYSLDSALSYLDLTNVADPKLTEAELGFATGAVYTATLKNGTVYTAKTGGTATGSDRWLKVSAAFIPVGTNATENAKLEQAVKDFNAKVGKWTYSVSSYSADNMAKSRKDLVKAKEEPKKEENKKEEKK